MMTDELSIWGYCCTGRLMSARHPDQHDHEIDDGREDRVLDEDVGERSHAIGRLPAACLPSNRGCAIATSAASRSLNEPDVATCSPAVSPSRITTSSPSSAPTCTGRCCARALPSLACRDHEDVVAAGTLAQRAHGDRRRPARAVRPAPGRGPMRPGRRDCGAVRSSRAPWRCASSDRPARRSR